MDQQKYSYGMIGLGTMGCNLVLNMADKGFSVAGYDKDPAKTTNLNTLAAGKDVRAFNSIQEFCSSLKTPRVIMLLVPAGPIVDFVINDIKPFLTPEDLIVDCGNSHFTDTQKRIDELSKENLHFMGLGISGGETGARLGPSIMPGGNKDAYERIGPMLKEVSAKVNLPAGQAVNEPCVAYMGSGAAGHYVKMVHNGIEYGLMQLISETYHLLKTYARLSNDEMHLVFKKWNQGKLQSFLTEITSAILLQKDDNRKESLLDKITDTAHQKGTGAWMSQDAMAIQSPIPVIDAAVSQRELSSLKAERVESGNLINKKEIEFTGDTEVFINQLEDALYFATIVVYAQGIAMLKNASEIHQYNTDIASVAKVWRGGCIIRAALLEDIYKAYSEQPDLKNLMMENNISSVLKALRTATGNTIASGIQNRIPLPCFSASIAYYDSYHSTWLPANLIQAQRDFFGAHTYERLDKTGIFHTNWQQEIL